MAFGLQWIFYNQPGEGENLLWWQVILFASIVPVGLAIMAWHHQQQEQAQVTNWQKLVTETLQRAEIMQQEAAAEYERAEQRQQEAETERERAAVMQAQSDELQSQLEQMQAEAAQMRITLDEKQAVSRAWQTLNPEMQTLALFNAQLLTAQDAAERLGVHVTTIRPKAKQLNGVIGKNIQAEKLEG